MRKIDEVLHYLGEPYRITKIDKEDVIYRSFGSYEFEVSGVSGRSNDFTLYVWKTSDVRTIIAIYSGIRGKENLKDVLGYYAAIYQNLLSQIRVEREE